MSRITLDPAVLPYLHLRDFHPLWLVFPVPFCLARQSRPQSKPRNASIPVWAPPRSLAATCGITFVFSSSGYLDVSVHRVSLRIPMDSVYGTLGSLMWVAPFRYLRISVYLPLPEAFRSLSRLSSALSAKAFTLRPF